MILDAHTHIDKIGADPAAFYERMQEAGVSGGVVISLWPDRFQPGTAPSWNKRLADLLRFADACERIYPFYWIDPLDEDAELQVAEAAKEGVRGFKVICDRFYPGDKRALDIFRLIAGTGKPVLFHSGILWDGKNSSRYNRPAEFEALLEVNGLRFALAHLSWPWCDEAIAVYGKYLNTRAVRPEYKGEMFIDIAPGTPPIYRRDALAKLFTVGYDVTRNVLFGSDSFVSDYNVDWTRQWIERDMEIYTELGVNQEIRNAIFGINLQRFSGDLSDGRKPDSLMTAR